MKCLLKASRMTRKALKRSSKASTKLAKAVAESSEGLAATVKASMMMRYGVCFSSEAKIFTYLKTSITADWQYDDLR